MFPEQKTIQPGLDTELLQAVPLEVIELLGAEKVLAIEEASSALEACTEFIGLLSPGQEEAVAPTTGPLGLRVEQAVKNIYENREIFYIDPATAMIEVEVLREESAIITEAVTTRIQGLKPLKQTTEQRLADVTQQTASIRETLASEASPDLPSHLAALRDLHVILGEVAEQFPSSALLQRLRKVLRFEQGAAQVDGATISARRSPDLVEEYKIKKANARRGSKQQKSIDEKRLQAILDLLITEGENDEGVMQHHRQFEAINHDYLYTIELSEFFAGARSNIASVHSRLKDNARTLANQPARELLDTLGEVNGTVRLKLEQRLRAGYDPINACRAAAAVEGYVAEHAQVLEERVRHLRIDAGQEMRKATRALTETPVLREYQQLARAADSQPVATPVETAPVAPDKEFRRACAIAKDTLRGGGRLDYPDAKRLAKQLHGLPCNVAGNAQLKPEENGIIIAIHAGKFSAVEQAIGRINSPLAGDDLQVQQLKVEAPEQLAIISGFHMAPALYQLERAVGDPDYRNRLVNILPPKEIPRVISEIQALAEKCRSTVTSEAAS